MSEEPLKPTAEPVEGSTKSTAEPVVEPVAEPVVEPVVEPVAGPASNASRRSGFGWGFWGVIITLAILVGGAQWRLSVWLSDEADALSGELTRSSATSDEGSKTAAQEAPAQVIEEHTVALPPTVRLQRSLIELSFKKGEERFAQAHQAMHEQVRSEFVKIKAESDQLIKGWADWYYSVTGEYTRLLKLLFAAAGEKSLEAAKRAANDYMEEQVRVRLIEPIKADERIERLEERLQAELKASNDEALSLITSHLERLQREAEAEGMIHEDDLKHLNMRFELLEQMSALNVVSPLTLATKLMSATGAKLALSTGAKAGLKVAAGTSGKAAGKAVGGVALKGGGKAGLKVTQAAVGKVAGRGLIKTAVALWGKMMIKFGAKSALKGGGAAAAAVTGTTSCAFLGLGAFACGAVAGTVAWFAVDKVVVEVDEYINRDKFERELRADLFGAWGEIEAELKAAIDLHFVKLQTILRYVPAPTEVKQTTLLKVLEGSEVKPTTQQTAPSTLKGDTQAH